VADAPMTEFTEKFKDLIIPYIAQYSQKNRTIGRLARAWQIFETDGSEEELKKRVEHIATVWKKRTDEDLANYDSLEEYLASKRSDAKKVPWKIFTELGLYSPPTREELEEWQKTLAEDVDDTLQTVDAKVEENFKPKEELVLHEDGGFIYVYHYPDELFNYNLIKEKASSLLQEAKLPRYKVGKAKNSVGAESRVKGQIGTSIHQVMQIALVIRTKDESKVEAIIHNILACRGKKCPDSVGEEWFFTSPTEIREIIEFIRKKSDSDSAVSPSSLR
jgi:hypothetical protein